MNPYVELLIVSFLFGTSGSFIKILHLPSTTLAFFRVGIPTIILFFYLTRKKIRLFHGNIRWLLIASVINAVRLLIMFMAFNIASIGNASIASSTGTLFLFMLSFIFLKEKITLKKTVLLFASLIGVAVLYSNQPMSFENKDFVGMSLAILSSVMYQFTVIIFKKELHKYSRTEAIFYQNVVGAVLFLPYLIFNRPFPAPWQLTVASVSGLLMGLVAFILYFSALKKVSPTAASIAMIDTVISVVLGVVLFGEHVTGNMIAGGVILLLSSFFINSELQGSQAKEVEKVHAA